MKKNNLLVMLVLLVLGVLAYLSSIPKNIFMWITLFGGIVVIFLLYVPRVRTMLLQSGMQESFLRSYCYPLAILAVFIIGGAGRKSSNPLIFYFFGSLLALLLVIFFVVEYRENKSHRIEIIMSIVFASIALYFNLSSFIARLK
ncbi:hypothetical protein ACFL5X_04345 [Candidatus Omnitrophota bacterium]